jgi:hypothetical protein
MFLEFDNNRESVRVVKSDGEALVFSTNTLYKSSNVLNAGGVFDVANRFIKANLTPQQQDQLWDHYLSAKELLLNPLSMQLTQDKLETIVKRIFDLIDPAKFHYFVEIKGGIIVPSNVKTSYNQVDESFTKDKTYLRDDYIKLVVLLSAIRMLIPIWGEFISITKDSVPDAQKEFRAYQLIRKSNLKNYPAFGRLLVYIQESHRSSKQAQSISNILGGIGREEIPEWIAGVLIVRKLGMINIHADESVSNVISQVSVYIDTTMRNMEKKFGDVIQEKRNASSVVDGEKDPSFLETFRVKQDLPFGNLVTSDVFAENVYEMCRTIDDTIPEQLVNAVLEVTVGLENEMYDESNVILAQWVLSTAISPTLYEVLEKRTNINAMIATQCLLHHWGYHELALISTGLNLKSGGGSGLDNRLLKPTLEHINKLDKMYPYQIQQRTRVAKAKSNNFAMPALHTMGVRLTRCRKAIRAPGFLTQDMVPTVDRHGHMTVPANIVHQLIDLLTGKLDEIQQKHYQLFETLENWKTNV